MVKTILCPTRGGEESYANQDCAITLAKEKKARLLFLYITDVSFLGNLASPILVDMETELDHMGQFMLAMAQERAEQAGTKAETIIRHGDFKSAILEVIKEYHVNWVVLGSPIGETAITTHSLMQKTIQSLIQETGVKILVVRHGEIMEEYMPED
jgi:nucleotide-binding universal stress UspA family protein